LPNLVRVRGIEIVNTTGSCGKSSTDVGRTVNRMNHIHEDSSFKFYPKRDGQPVQLCECWCDVVARTNTKNISRQVVNSPGAPASQAVYLSGVDELVPALSWV
jgi:hypothetical protein